MTNIRTPKPTSTATPTPAPTSRRRRRDTRGKLEPTDVVRRQGGRERAADEPLAGHRAPEPRVVGLAAVVAHHVPVVLGNRDLPGEVAADRARAVLRVVLVQRAPVEDHA